MLKSEPKPLWNYSPLLMSTLAAAQAHTDQRLDALIDIARRRFEEEAQS
jgi:hypothetical protein